jgi:hypothetical protein
MLILSALEGQVPGTIATVEIVQPIAEAVLKGASQYKWDSNGAKAFSSIDSLSGKRVRIEYLDGKGVVSLQPVGCSLTKSEFEYLEATAVLSDCYLFPSINAAEGEGWNVEASQLQGLMDPTMRARPSGSIRISREANEQKEGTTVARLRVSGGPVSLDSSTDRKKRLATFSPRGALLFSFEDGYTTNATLSGVATMYEVSTDHLIFKEEFSFEPDLQVQYSCKMR